MDRLNKNIFKNTFTGGVLAIILFSSASMSYAEDTAKKSSDSTSIDQILVSDTPNSEGYVLKTKDSLPSNTPKIYATAQLGSAVEGSVVTATLVYLPTQSKIGPVVAKVSTTGNTMEAFSFTNTKMPWPKGEYEVDVSTASGDTQKVNFKIDD